MDNRAQSMGIVKLFLSLIVGAIVIWIVDIVTTPILAGTRESTTNETALQGTDWISQGIEFLPIAFLLIAFLGLIVLSIYQREMLR